MIFSWTFFIVCAILTISSLFCAITNIIEYVKQIKGKGEHRFTYIVATVMFTLFAAIMADTLFK